jgi:hypothetical protein
MIPKPACNRAVFVLALVILVELLVFTTSCWERWRKALGRSATGRGLVIRCDGLGYYAWLRSLLIDGDWSFDDEFDRDNPLHDYVPPPDRRTALDRRANPWSVGPACVWTVGVLPAHLGLRALEGGMSPWPADGYSPPYQLLVGTVTLLVSFLGLGLSYATCRRYARPERAALAVAFLALGSTVIYYAAIEGSMAHGVGTAAVAVLVWYWLTTYGSESPRRWLLVGVLTGVAALMRWQLVTFAVLPVGEGLFGRRKWLPGVAMAGAAVAFPPQMIAWRVVYGAWLTTPYPVAHNWLTPSLWQVLFSQDRSFFYWTPVTLLACAASGWMLWHASRPRLPTEMVLLAAAFVLQVYAVASVWGEEAYLGVAYGFRPLTESVVVLAPGLAYLLDRASPRWFLLLCAVGCLLVLWNLILITQYRYGWVPAAGGADPATLLANAVRLFRRKHALVLGPVVLGPVLLAWLALAKRRSFSAADALG